MNPTHQAADKALAERSKLHRFYIRSRRAELTALCCEPDLGEQLHEFIRGLRKQERPEPFLAFVTEELHWLREAPERFRVAALALVNAHITRLRIRAGLPEFDDGMPGEDDTVFRICKQELGL